MFKNLIYFIVSFSYAGLTRTMMNKFIEFYILTNHRYIVIHTNQKLRMYQFVVSRKTGYNVFVQVVKTKIAVLHLNLERKVNNTLFFLSVIDYSPILLPPL